MNKLVNQTDYSKDLKEVIIQQDANDDHEATGEVFKIPSDFYWLNRFVPELAGEYLNRSDINSRTHKLHELCNKCIEIQDWFKSHPFGMTDKPQSFPHHGEGPALIMSAYGGCHLCSILLLSIAGWVPENRPERLVIRQYEVILQRCIVDNHTRNGSFMGLYIRRTNGLQVHETSHSRSLCR